MKIIQCTNPSELQMALIELRASAVDEGGEQDHVNYLLDHIVDLHRMAPTGRAFKGWINEYAKTPEDPDAQSHYVWLVRELNPNTSRKT